MIWFYLRAAETLYPGSAMMSPLPRGVCERKGSDWDLKSVGTDAGSRLYYFSKNENGSYIGWETCEFPNQASMRWFILTHQ